MFILSKTSVMRNILPHKCSILLLMGATVNLRGYFNLLIYLKYTAILLFISVFLINPSSIHAFDSIPEASSSGLIDSNRLKEDTSSLNSYYVSPDADSSISSYAADTAEYSDTSSVFQDSEESVISEDWPDSASISRDTVSVDTSVRKSDTISKIGLYPGVSAEQDSLAKLLLNCVWLFDWDDVDKIAHKMRKLESREHRPALSILLWIASNVVRLQFGEFKDERSARNRIDDIEKEARTGLVLSDPDQSHDSVMATNLLIYGGIKGLTATLHIEHNPIAAATEGLSALNNIEKCLAMRPSIKDAHLGQGIFYCALAKASPIVRGALNLIGRPVSLEKGIAFMRESADSGRYTSTLSRIYLSQYLSPYIDRQVAEKRKIYRKLINFYPANPYFLFIAMDENLCFHPEHVFDPSIRRMVKRKIAAFSAGNYSRNRYAALVKWQYFLVDPFASAKFRPDTTFDLKEFSYYPVFLSGLREKLMIQQSYNRDSAVRQRQIKDIKHIEIRAKKMLQGSQMSTVWKGYYLWHLRDGLRVK
jgi:hypothetical protein